MTTPAKIEPWMVEAVKEMMVKHLGFGATYGTNWMLLESDLVASIAAHAPEQEWEAKEKALREFCEYLRAGTQYQTVKDYHIAFKIEAILNREQEKP